MAFTIHNDGKGRAFFQASAREFKASLAKTNRAIGEIIRVGIQNTALKTFKKNSPSGLARSFKVSGVSDKGALVQSDKVYAGIQDRGGIIRRKTAPYLVFQTADGKWHSVKQVRIPATHYIANGVASVSRSIESFVGEQVETVMKKAASTASSGGQAVTRKVA